MRASVCVIHAWRARRAICWDGHAPPQALGAFMRPVSIRAVPHRPAGAGLARHPTRALLHQSPHLLDQIGLALEADARQRRQVNVTVAYLDTVRKAAVGLEKVRVALVAAQVQSRRDGQGHLVATVRDAA